MRQCLERKSRAGSNKTRKEQSEQRKELEQNVLGGEGGLRLVG